MDFDRRINNLRRPCAVVLRVTRHSDCRTGLWRVRVELGRSTLLGVCETCIVALARHLSTNCGHPLHISGARYNVTST